MLQPHNGRLNIVGEAADGREAVTLINTLKPDVVFLDIQMRDWDGFDVLRHLKEPLPYIIFVTAFDQYAIRAFEENAIDYLLKPVDRDRLQKSLDKVERMALSGDKTLTATIYNMLNNLPPKNPFLTVRLGDRAFFLNPDDIACFEARDKRVYVHTADTAYITEHTLNTLEEMLPGERFKRVHRSYIVNVSFIKEARKWFGGGYRLILNVAAQTTVPVSRSFKKNLGL